MRRYFYKTQPGYDLYCKPISGRDTGEKSSGQDPGRTPNDLHEYLFDAIWFLSF